MTGEGMRSVHSGQSLAFTPASYRSCRCPFHFQFTYAILHPVSFNIPPQFSLCQNVTCSQAPRCLRYLGYEQETSDKSFISVVNPFCYPQEGEVCPFFRCNEPVQLAWGIKGIFDTIPYALAKQIKEQIIATLGKSRYYRVLREEIPLTPQQQQVVQQIFSNYGVDTPPTYRYFTQDYQWFPR